MRGIHTLGDSPSVGYVFFVRTQTRINTVGSLTIDDLAFHMGYIV